MNNLPIRKTILVADSGSTKTAWKLIGHSSDLECITPGINPYFQDSKSISEVLSNESDFQELLKIQPNEVYFYGAGCSTIENQRTVSEAFHVFFPNSIIQISHDMLAAARSLCGHEPGIACILGTGSNSCLFDGNEITENLPNLGFWLGDEGSGGFLGKDLVVKWFHKEMPIDLWKKFEDKFQLNRDVFLDQIYHKPYPNRYVAKFAKFLGEHIENEWCRNFVANAFTSFFERFILPYKPGAQLPIHFIGSIAFHFKPVLEEVIHKFKLKPGKIEQTAIDGLVQFHKPLN